MVDTGDEFSHRPTESDSWQENYMFLGWDERRRVATYLHLCHRPAEGTVEVKALVGMDGVVVSGDYEHSGADCLAADGLWADVTTPLEKWNLRFQGHGTEAPAGSWTTGQGPVPFGFDLNLHARSAAVDWSPLVDLVGFPERIAKTHYEQGMKLTGTAWIRDRSTEVTGLLVRDHTWGPREFDFDLGFWTPMVFGESEYFVCGSSALINGSWIGLLMHSDETGTIKVAGQHVARANGPLVPGRYTAAEVFSFSDNSTHDHFAFDGRLTVPVPYPSLSKAGRVMTDLYSRVTYRDKVGFGTFQWA